MKWYLNVLKKYAVFSGRAQRKEYWMFILVYYTSVFAIGFIEGFLGLFPETDVSVLGAIYNLALFIPSIAVSVRRMHDTDHSGWFIWIPIYSFILLCRNGDKGENRFGEDPKMFLE